MIEPTIIEDTDLNTVAALPEPLPGRLQVQIVAELSGFAWLLTKKILVAASADTMQDRKH
jgi:hypothetical protein